MHKVIIKYASIKQESQEDAIKELVALSKKLQDLLPDPSLSPLERVERLARLIPESIQSSSECLTARKKLNQIRLRLAELVPDEQLSASEKIDYLIQKAHDLVPEETSRFFEKLEKIGDCRMIDNGAVPFPGWKFESRFWPHLPSQKTEKESNNVSVHKIQESPIYAACGPLTRWESSKYAWEMLHKPLSSDSTLSVLLEGPCYSISLIEGALQKEIWDSVPLAEHVLLTPSSTDEEFLKLALEHLLTHHEKIAVEKLKFLKAVAFVELREDQKGQTTSITSASFPTLPFCSFFSRKAFVHIPPQTVSHEPNISFFAENIYHEMVHQQVILDIFENDLLASHYDAKSAPKIEIPWRRNLSERMQFWEIDRVLHALSVYVALLPYRLGEAEQHPDSPKRGYFEEALICARFLLKGLRAQQDFLTVLGHDLIDRLATEIKAYAPSGFLA